MSLLRKKYDLCSLQKLPALPQSEIYERICPFALQLGLTFADNEIRFPQPLCFEQQAIHFSAYCEKLYPKCIPYDDIVIMESYGNKLKVVLRSGHIFHFVENRDVWLVRNALNYGKPPLITVWWWQLSGWITLWWWRLTKR